MTKIITFYSIFVVVMKLIFVLQQYFDNQEILLLKSLAFSNGVIAIPFIILAILGFLSIKKEKFNWIFVILGAAIIIVIRAFEADLHIWLQNIFLS